MKLEKRWYVTATKGNYLDGLVLSIDSDYFSKIFTEQLVIFCFLMQKQYIVRWLQANSTIRITCKDARTTAYFFPMLYFYSIV